MVYGICIVSIPILILNLVGAALNGYYLVQMTRSKVYYNYVVAKYDTSAYVQYFLLHYRKDIKKYFPHFNAKRIGRNATIVMVLRNASSVGMFIYHKVGKGVAIVDLDYAIPEYRNLKNMFFLLHSSLQKDLKKQHIHQFVAHSAVKKHQNYLRKVGFISQPDEPERFVLKLHH